MKNNLGNFQRALGSHGAVEGERGRVRFMLMIDLSGCLLLVLEAIKEAIAGVGVCLNKVCEDGSRVSWRQ